MIKTNLSVNSVITRLIVSGLCLIMGSHAFAQANVSDISEIVVLKNKDSFEKKLELVKNAKHSIWMSVMVFDCRPSSKELFHEMMKKQEEGLDVRILAEGLYMKTLAHPCYKYLTENGMKVTQVFDHLRKGGSLTRMMHQKFFVIDEQDVIMGGQNFHKYENTSTWENHYVRDTDVYLKSPRIAQVFREEFAWMWNFFNKKYDKIENVEFISQNDPLNQSACRVLIQNPRRQLDEADDFLKKQLSIAEHSLKMCSPSASFGKAEFFSMLKDKVSDGKFSYEFVRPGHSKFGNELAMVLDDALKSSKKKVNPIGIVAASIGKFINKLLVKSSVNKGFKSLHEAYGDHIKLYDYPRYTHSKIYIFDEKIAMIGSVNLDDNSLDINYEIAFSCDDPRFVSQLVTVFNEDVSKTKQTLPVEEKISGELTEN